MYIAQLDQARVFNAAIVTKIELNRPFYGAEDYHQDFLKRNPTHPYIVVNDLPKIEDLKRLFPALYRPTPVLVGYAVMRRWLRCCGVRAARTAVVAEPRKYVARVRTREHDDRTESHHGSDSKEPGLSRSIMHEQCQRVHTQNRREHERNASHNRRMMEVEAEILGIRLIRRRPSTERKARTQDEQAE